MKKCTYNITWPPNEVIDCNAYSQSVRPDEKFWAHWPKCSKENCPIEHSDLLEGAALSRVNIDKEADDLTTLDFVYCKSCLLFDDCENTESRDGCYLGESAMEDL